MMVNNTRKLIFLSMITALTIVLGLQFKVPTPTGFVTLLDGGIFFTAFYFGKREGALVGALSGFLIDLLAGYPQWMFFSLLIHGAQGYLAGIEGFPTKRGLGICLASLVMVLGYALAGGLLSGFGASLPEIPGNIMQNLVGIVTGYLLSSAAKQVFKRGK